MQELTFLQDLAIVMVVSAVIIIFCQRFKLPVVLGYIFAGVVIGPHTPPFPLIKDVHSIHTLSELGIIFLLFSIGLEFSFSRLLKVGLVAFVAATLEILFMLGIGYAAGRAFGWSVMSSVFLGAILSISSTTIIAKILLETKKIQEKFAQVILGILVIEDILAIIIIAILSGVASTGSLEWQNMGMAMLRVLSFVISVIFVGFLAIPPLLKYLATFEQSEVTIVTLTGLCFAAALLAAKFGFSVALGSFLIGAIIGETKYSEAIVHKMEPIKDMFTAIFFVSVGMLIDPTVLGQFWLPIVLITLITIAGKVWSCSVATFLTGYSIETSLKVGLGLAQIGEFSFIIARLGESTGVTASYIYPIAVSVSAITTLTTPMLMQNATSISRRLSDLTPPPVKTILNLYTSWFQKLREAGTGEKTPLQKGLILHISRLFIYGGSAVALFFAVSRFRESFTFIPLYFYWALTGVCMLPIFTGFTYALDRLLWDMLAVKLARIHPKTEQNEYAYQMFHNAFRFLMTLVTGLLFLAVGSAFIPSLPLAIAVFGLVVISSFSLWGSARRAHEKIEKVVMGVFDQEKPTEPQTVVHDELVKLIQQEYPWEVETEDFLLPYRESGANQSVRDLRLRSETGATIVGIYRDQESVHNPPPDTVLLPGDVLLLMGDRKQLKAAIVFLSQKIKEPAVKTQREGMPKTQMLILPSGSAYIGKTLSDVKLGRKTGVTVLGIQKAHTSINNPSPDTVLGSGDKLILFGWPEQLEKAVQYFGEA